MITEIDRFLEYAKSNRDYILGSPVTEREIARFEARYSVQFPLDASEYCLKINGLYCQGSSTLSPTLFELSKWHRLTRQNRE